VWLTHLERHRKLAKQLAVHLDPDGVVPQGRGASDLQNLVRHVDGCGSVPDAKSVPDANDWIVDCESQTAVRALLSGLIDTLDRFIDGPR